MIKLFLHYLYWILIFFGGIIQLYQMNSAIYKIGIPLLAVILFIYQFIASAGRLKYPLYGIPLAFVAVSITSAILNGIDYFSLINFMIYTVLSYCYFIVLVNESNLLVIQKIIHFLKILVLIQIPAIIVKFILVGQSEGEGIGTLSEGGGSISTIFPLFIITFLFCLYLFQEKKIYFFLMFCFLFFAIVGDKRAIVFFVPLMIVVSYFFFIRFSKLKYFSGVGKKIAIVGSLSCLVLVLVVKTNKSLNPENSLWGSFNIEYLSDYVTYYTGSGDKDVSEMRRKDGFVYFLNYAISGDVIHIAFGDGAGKLIQSKHNNRSGLMIDEYGIRYGGRMGIIWLLMQVGVLGSLVYLLLFAYMFFYVTNNYKDSPVYLAFLALTVVFFLDTFTYSYVFLRFEYLKGLYFVLFGLIFLDQKFKTLFFSDLAKI